MKVHLFLIALATMLLDGCGGSGGGESAAPPPTDPASTSQTLESVAAVVNVKSVHNAGYTGSGVLIAAVDSGIRATHTVFNAADLRLVDSWNFISEGPALIENNADVSDLNGHGTGVASILVGSGGVRGIAPAASLLPVRAGDEDLVFGPVAIDAAVSHAVAKGAAIINMSFELAPTADMRDLLDDIAGAGRIGIIGAGNTGHTDPYPAEMFDQDGFLDVLPSSEGHFLAVGATTTDGTTLAAYSNKAGVMKDRFIVAPGSFLVADASSDTAQSFVAGTSFATPIVSAAAALVWQANPALTAAEVTSLLCSTAKDMGEPGNDEIYGCGLLDVGAAVNAALAVGG